MGDNLRKLYLIRHGQTIFNETGKVQGWSDSPLSKLGLRQTEAAKQFINDKNLHFDKVYSSPLSRCLTTTKLLIDQEYEEHPGLMEWNFGYYEGDENKVVFKDGRWNKLMHGEDQDYFKVKGGESYQEFVDRINLAFKEIIDAGHESTLAVTHGAVLRIFFNTRFDESLLKGEGFYNNCIMEYNINENNEVEFVAIYNPAKGVK